MSVVTDKVSIIIVTHNSARLLPGCLRSLQAATEQVPHEVIVADNGSCDQSVALVRELIPDAIVLGCDCNEGFARACNRGAKRADGELLLFVNPDLELDPATVAGLGQAVASNPRSGLVAGRLRYPDGWFQPSCRNLPTVANLLFSRGSFLTGLFGSGRARTYTLGDFENTTPVPAVAGTLVMVKRDVFFELGGFDERFFMYMEDTDLSKRAGEAGHVNLFVPSAGAVHRWGQGSTIGRLRRRWYHHLSVWKYFRKHRGFVFTVLLVTVPLALNFLLVLLLPERRRD